MSAILTQQGLYTQIQFLSSDEKENPSAVLREIPEDHKMSTLKEVINDMLEVCLTCDFSPFDESDYRSDTLYTVKTLIKLIEAASFVPAELKRWQETVVVLPEDRYKDIDKLTHDQALEASGFYAKYLSLLAEKYKQCTERVLAAMKRLP
ncbi:MAG TPA: hypothetical protein VGN00_07610 [Puia sp.]|jgi:hypothetical protein